MKYLILLFLTVMSSGVTYAIMPDDIINGKRNVILNDDDFNTFLIGVRDGDRKWLRTVPRVSEYIPSNKSNELRDALSLSIIKSPSETINVLNEIDKVISDKGHSMPRDKFGSDSVCLTMIDINRYDRESFFKYYHLAESSLKRTGVKGKHCLDIMNSYVEEIKYEEKERKMKWGSEKYIY
ncbi:hypothetical protein EH228_17240 [Erwinia endophytica]|uniref:hypothetical protein n=1 Tax=Erwinia endophytica TaxID=1563158 RepID=UPI001265EC6B|nr:hypothetical protein [Erwinia endophytica]KAB8306709.1 hypothetical protein EH228_17240 [Erwinia endophytica]